MVEVIDFILEGGPTLRGAGSVWRSHAPGPRARSRAPDTGVLKEVDSIYRVPFPVMQSTGRGYESLEW